MPGFVYPDEIGGSRRPWATTGRTGEDREELGDEKRLDMSRGIGPVITTEY